MDLNKDLHSKKLVRLNENKENQVYWKWRVSNNSIEAFNITNAFAWRLLIPGLIAAPLEIILVCLSLMYPHSKIGISHFIPALLSLLVIVIPATVMIKWGEQIVDYLSHNILRQLVMDKVKLNKGVSNNSLDNIANSLNNFKNKNDKDNYDKILWDVKHSIPSDINNNYGGTVTLEKAELSK